MSKKEVVQRESRQPRFDDDKDLVNNISYFVDWVYRSHLVEPTFSTDTREYDNWLIDFANNEPHLVSVLSQVVSKDTNRAWTLTGGQRNVRKFGDRLRGVEGGDGWRHFISMQSRAFYNTNMGAITEIETVTGRVGDELWSLYHVDSTVTRLFRDYETPLRYYPNRGKVQYWKRGEFFRTVSNPDLRERWLGIGMCAVNRCLSLAKMLVAVYEHDLEQLGASPPKGFLVGDNITIQQYEDAITKRKIAKENGQLEFDILALFSSTSGLKTDLNFIPYSTLPTNFNLSDFTYLIILGYAMAFGYDAQEFYPVQSGSFGQDKQAELQAEKTTYKGEADFSLEYQNHVQMTLPEGLIYEFDRNNTQGDLLEIERDSKTIDNALKMYSPPNRQMGESGLILADEGRQYLAERGIIDSDWLGTEMNPVIQADENDTDDLSDDLDDIDQTDDNDDGAEVVRLRRQYRDRDDIVRESERRPDDPIIQLRFTPEDGITTSKTIWQRGGDLRDSHRNWRGVNLKKPKPKTDTNNPLSREFKTDKGVFYDPFLALIVNHNDSCDCASCEYVPRNIERFIGYVPKTRAEEGAVLYQEGDVLITEGDVDLAIEEAYEVSTELGDLLIAQEMIRVANLKTRLFTWDSNLNRYRYENGQFVSPTTVREWTQESIDNQTDKSAFLASQVTDGSLSPDDFRLIAREEIKREYIRQYVSGVGGRDQMTPSDWGRIGQQLRVQYTYLDGFVADIGSKDLTDGQINARLNMYFESAKHSYWSGVMVASGLSHGDLPAYPGDGTTICLTNCRCYWDFRPLYRDGIQIGYTCSWRRTISESCDTCVTREIDWSSVEVLFS